MKNARSDWPVWFQIFGAVAVVIAVGVLAGPGWALLAAGAVVLAVGVMSEVDRDLPAHKRPAPPRPQVDR